MYRLYIVNCFTILGIEQFSSGRFEVEHSGIYYIACALTISISKSNMLTVAVSINNENMNESTLQSASYELPSTFTLQVVGTIHCNKNDFLSILIGQQRNEIITVKRESRLSVRMISSTMNRFAFSLRLKHDSRRNFLYRNMLNKFKFTWTSLTGYGLFMQHPSPLVDNCYVIQNTGLYFMSGNFVFKNYKLESCHNEIQILKNNNIKLMALSRVSFPSQNTLSISFSNTFNLSKGDRIRLVLSSQCFSTFITNSSTYSLVKIGYNQMLFYILEKILQYHLDPGWLKIDMSNYLVKGSVQFPELHHESSDISLHHSGLLLFSLVLNLQTNFDTKDIQIRILHCKNMSSNKSFSFENAIKTDSVTLTSSSTYSDRQISLSISFLLKVVKYDVLQLYIYFPQSGAYTILDASFLTILYLVHENQVKFTNVIIDSNDWTLIKIVSAPSDVFITYKRGIMEVFRAGVYYFTAIVFVQSETEAIAFVSLIFDHEMISKRKEIISSKKNLKKGMSTVSFASSIRINAGQKFGIYIKTLQNNILKATTTFRLKFIGSLYYIQGFQANLLSDQHISVNKLHTIDSYYDPGRVVLSSDFSYNIGNMFDFESGIFTAKADGSYLISTNIITRSTKIKESISIVLRIYVKGLLFGIVEPSPKSWTSNQYISYVSFLFSRVGLLKQGDKVTLKIFSQKDSTSYIIDKLSSFSIVKIGKPSSILKLQYNNANIPLSHSYIQLMWWKSVDYKQDTLTINNNKIPELIDNEKIKIKITGTYFVSYQLFLSETFVEKLVMAVRIYSKLNEEEEMVYCFIGRNSTNTGCSVILYLNENDELSVRIFTKVTSPDGRFIKIGKNDNDYGFLDVSALQEPVIYQMAFNTLEVKNISKVF